ncbi:hypothetical protein, partial [Paraprevotella clara]
RGQILFAQKGQSRVAFPTCIPKASLTGNDIVDARSTVTISIAQDWNICCLCFIIIFVYDYFAKV